MPSAARKAIPISKFANVESFAPSLCKGNRISLHNERQQERRQQRKLDQALRVMDAAEARAKHLAELIQALQKVKARAEARRQAIEDRLISELQSAGFERFHSAANEVRLRNAPLALLVTDESEIAPHFFREKVVRSLDKVAVKAALQAGEEVPGCALTQKVSLVRK